MISFENGRMYRIHARRTVYKAMKMDQWKRHEIHEEWKWFPLLSSIITQTQDIKLFSFDKIKTHIFETRNSNNNKSNPIQS